MERSPETCILCQTPQRERLIEKDNWIVFKCPTCGLGFLDPRPSENEIAELYRRDYFSERYDEGIDPGSEQYRKRLSGEQHRTQFIKAVKPSGHLLDIGCGYGYFLDACRRQGYQVQGLDVSEWAAQYATEKLGLSIAVGKVGEVALPSESFDVVTMWHSLEHTQDPRAVLKTVKSWLKPDGILVVDVPNYKGTDAQKMGHQWEDWSLPYHLWHFTPGSLQRLLEQYGFKIIKSKTYHSNYIKAKLKRIPVVGLLARLIAKRYSGTSVAVIAKLQNYPEDTLE